MATSDSYDFIVVGAGPSGSVVASRLAHSSSHPSVLLVEAGGSNVSLDRISGEDRYARAFTPGSPLNWFYKTQPQNQLSGQVIDYARGKGLGGSTAINFCGWTVGPRDDYDEWARLVGDESFGWSNARKCLDKIENLHPKIPDPKLSKYINPKPEDHSTSGAIHLAYGSAWMPDVGDIFTAAEQIGIGTNSDVNDGDPIGMGMGSVCIYNGQRMSATNGYLSSSLPNLTILTNSHVAKIVFEGMTAVGVKTVSGTTFSARKEVVISGGALNTPQLLKLSGIGPREELEKHEIPLVHDLQNVGENLRDHCLSYVGLELKKDAGLSESSEKQSPSPMGWFKLPSVLASKEQAALPESLKTFMNQPTVPNIEICTHNPPMFLSYTGSPETSYLGAMCLIMNPQSTGTVLLQSSDPTLAPLFDPKFLSHPYDRRVIVDGMRELMRLLSAPVYAAKTVKKLFPKDDTDESIWEWVRENCASSWHMSGTVCMGVDSESACVDSNFRVFGLDNLRVVDLSVCPFVPNAHTQSTAYVLGEMAAKKLIKEYDF